MIATTHLAVRNRIATGYNLAVDQRLCSMNNNQLLYMFSFAIGSPCYCSNNAAIVEALLEAGADVNGIFDDDQRTTPLIRAVQFGNPRIVRAVATFPGVKFNAEVSEV